MNSNLLRDLLRPLRKNYYLQRQVSHMEDELSRSLHFKLNKITANSENESNGSTPTQTLSIQWIH